MHHDVIRDRSQTEMAPCPCVRIVICQKLMHVESVKCGIRMVAAFLQPPTHKVVDYCQQLTPCLASDPEDVGMVTLKRAWKKKSIEPIKALEDT